jgi:RecB family endonuclease NucS
MSFCSLTPGEVEILIKLLEEKGEKEILPEIITNKELANKPMPFEPHMGIQDIRQAFRKGLFINEAHLEYSIIAKPNLLPDKLRPKSNDVICRQVPISPFKPYNMDRADICYFSSEDQNNSMIPNTVIELKRGRASNKAINQVIRYLDWLYLICEQEKANNIKAYVVAPSFTSNTKINKHKDQIELVSVN